MIDVHSHILPLVDDGSPSLERSLEMLKIQIDSGVTSVIVTPHYRGDYKLPPTELKKLFNDFCGRVKAEGLTVDLFLGQEIFVEENLKNLLQDKLVLSMNATKYLLLEFSYFDEYDIAETVYEVVRQGYTPIIAHPERYVYLTVEDVLEIKSLGGLIQINADSLFVKDVHKIKTRARKLLYSGAVDFIAGDFHNGRKYYMQKAKRLVSKKLGRDAEYNLFYGNALKIIQG